MFGKGRYLGSLALTFSTACICSAICFACRGECTDTPQPQRACEPHHPAGTVTQWPSPPRPHALDASSSEVSCKAAASPNLSVSVSLHPSPMFAARRAQMLTRTYPLVRKGGNAALAPHVHPVHEDGSKLHWGSGDVLAAHFLCLGSAWGAVRCTQQVRGSSPHAQECSEP